MDWLKWDPISSGEGDLQLEDMAKSFAATIGVSNSVKAIDFDSLIDNMPPHSEKFLTAKAVDVPSAATGVSGKYGRRDLLPETEGNALFNSPSKNQTLDYGSSQELCFPNDAGTNSTIFEEIGASTNTTEEEPKDLNGNEALVPFFVTQKHDLLSQKDIPDCELNSMVLSEDIMHQRSDAEAELTDTCVPAAIRIETLSENANFPAPQIKKCMNSQGSDATLDAEDVLMDKNIAQMGVIDQEETPVIENISGRQYCKESKNDTITCADHVRFPLVSSSMKTKEAPSVAKWEITEEVAMEEQEVMETQEEVGIKEETLEEVAMEEREVGELGHNNDLKAKYNSPGPQFMPSDKVAMEEQKLEEIDAETNNQVLFPSSSGTCSLVVSEFKAMFFYQYLKCCS